MSTEAVAKAPETPQQKRNRLRKEFAKKNQKSISVKVQEMEYADWNPTTRMTLLVIALGQRVNEDAYVPEECPLQGDDILGWCDMAQWRIALRVGKCERQIRRVIAKLEKDGILEIKRWEDTNHTHHDLYRVIESKLDELQRPEQTENVPRPSRYKADRKATPGSFKTGMDNPQHAKRMVAVMEEDDE